MPGLEISKIIKGYYYLTPLWFLIEKFVWPDLRAEMIVGHSLLGAIIFYAVEGGIGAAYWFQKPFAGPAALMENIAYLLGVIRYIFITPLNIAANLDANAAQAESASNAYIHSLPGILFSALLVVFFLQRRLSNLR